MRVTRSDPQNELDTHGGIGYLFYFAAFGRSMDVNEKSAAGIKL